MKGRRRHFNILYEENEQKRQKRLTKGKTKAGANHVACTCPESSVMLTPPLSCALPNREGRGGSLSYS